MSTCFVNSPTDRLKVAAACASACFDTPDLLETLASRHRRRPRQFERAQGTVSRLLYFVKKVQLSEQTGSYWHTSLNPAMYKRLLSRLISKGTVIHRF